MERECMPKGYHPKTSVARLREHLQSNELTQETTNEVLELLTLENLGNNCQLVLISGSVLVNLLYEHDVSWLRIRDVLSVATLYVMQYSLLQEHKQTETGKEAREFLIKHCVPKGITRDIVWNVELFDMCCNVVYQQEQARICEQNRLCA